MINKNDLRFIKTESLIRTTYMQLLAKKTNPVTVTELCKKAMINKSTFYSHYACVENLHTTLCNEKISEMLSSGGPGIMLFFEDTRTCLESLYRLFYEYREDIGVLFPARMDIVEPFEKAFLSAYDSINISEEQKYVLRFCLGGILHLMSSKDSSGCQEIILNLVEKCVSNQMLQTK